MFDPNVHPAELADVEALTTLHDAAFPGHWSQQFWRAQLREPTSIVLVAGEAGRGLTGFLLARRVADEAEIVSIGVHPGHRRKGIAGALLDHLTAAVCRDPPCRLILEVSVENVAAEALYAQRGFREVGYRKGYYAVPDRDAIDARILALDVPQDLALDVAN